MTPARKENHALRISVAMYVCDWRKSSLREGILLSGGCLFFFRITRKKLLIELISFKALILMFCMKVMVKLVKQLFDRDCRRRFCPEKHWLSSRIHLDGVCFCMVILKFDICCKVYA